MSPVLIRHAGVRWLALLLVITLVGTPLVGFAQNGSPSSDATGLKAKVTAGSAALAGIPFADAMDQGQRAMKSSGAGSAAAEVKAPAQVMTAVHQAMTAAGTPAKGKYGLIDNVQRKQLASLSETRKGDADFQVRFDSAAGTPAMIKLAAAKTATGLRAGDLATGAATARSFLNEQKTLLGITDPDAELDLKRQWNGPLGHRHFRYQQQVAGIPVWGREALVHVDGSDTVYLYQGHTEKTPAQMPAGTARIDVDEALASALTHLDADEAVTAAAVESADSLGDLIYYPVTADDLVLCYQVGVEAGFAHRWWYFIDAESGGVVHRVSRVADAVEAASGTSLLGRTRSFNAWSEGGRYYVVDPTIPDTTDTPHDPVANPKSKGDLYILDAQNGESNLYYITSSSASGPWDEAGVSAVYNTGVVHDYYKTTFSRNGIDNANMHYQVIVHLKENYANAFWNGTYIVFGDGDGTTFSNLAASLDITAHEIQHGVTQFTAGLIYENQSGALNEAYSDIFACMVDRDDWTVGEDITIPSPGFLRDLANPARGLTPLPTKMSEYRNMPVDEDHGGVHINMSIPSRAGYLIAEGLTTEGLGTAIGRDKTEQIFFRALTTYLSASSNFADGRSATLQAAEDLYGSGSAEVTAVAAGWDAVEIYGSGGTPSDPDPTPADPVSGNDIMVYLRPLDGSHNSGSENFDLHVQTLPSPFTGYSASQDSADLNRAQYVHYTKPAAYSASGGTLILYVGNDRNIYAVNADGTGEETKITNFDKSAGDDGVWSIALSPDGRYFAFTSDNPSDNNIYVGDLSDESTTTYELTSSTTEHPGDSSELNTIYYADSLAFDYTSSKLVFDALNCVSAPDSPCSESDADSGYRYWSVGILDLNSEDILYPFPNQNPDYDLSYPSFATNNSFIITLDEIDRSVAPIGSAVWTYNWNDGTSYRIANPNIDASNRAVYGVPTFWGDDDFITLQASTSTNGNAYRVGITSDWDDDGTSTQLNSNDAAMPFMHRTGTRDLATDLTLNRTSINFGSVAQGGSESSDIILSNTGERDIKITGISSSSAYFVHNGANTLLPRNSNMTIEVTFTAPASDSTESGTLTITSDADTPTYTISLSGQSGAGGGSGSGSGGGGSSGGGCFILTLMQGAADR